MSLAPTLRTLLIVQPLLGAALVAGRAVGTDAARLTPGPALVTLGADTIPTIITQEGPVAAPEQAIVTAAGYIPSLGRTLIITPSLSDSVGESNDLTPTLVWGGGAAPGRALVTVAGLEPTLLRDGGQTIYPTTGSALLAPLAPEVILPEGQVQLREPHRAQLDVIELAPTLVLGMTLDLPASAFTAQGYAPQLVGLRYGWQPLPPAAAPGWTEVPRV